MEPKYHPLGNGNVGPSPAAITALHRLRQLQPLTSLTAMSEALDRASVVLTDRAIKREQTKNVLDRMREQNRSNRAKGNQ